MRFSSDFLADLRSRVPLSTLVGRKVTWDRKMSRRHDFWACCPMHGEKRPSFHVDDMKGRMKCFGCHFGGDHFTWLQEVEGLSFPDAVAELAGIAGVPLPERSMRPLTQEDMEARQKQQAKAQALYEIRKKEIEEARQEQEEQTRAAALSIWEKVASLRGTIGETYLRSRGYMAALDYPDLGFVPNLRHKNGTHYPAIICAVRGSDMEFLGVWRIYLSPTGAKLPEEAKLGLGRCVGGCVWLGEPAKKINAVEGLETGLSVRSIINHKEPVAVCLSTSGLVNFKPPAAVKSVLIWPDGDADKLRLIDGVERYVESPGIKAAKQAVHNLGEIGIKAAMQPIARGAGDFNEIAAAAACVMTA